MLILKQFQKHVKCSHIAVQVFEVNSLKVSELARLCKLKFLENPLVYFLYARLKNGRIMLYPSVSVRPSVRPSVNFFVSV